MAIVQFTIRKENATTGYSLQQANSVVTTDANHESAPPISLDIEEIPFQDGGKLVSSTFQPKSIILSGKLKAASQTALDSLIETFKLNTHVVFGNLDISYAGGFRRFTVTTESVVIARSRQEITVCGFSLSLKVIDPPFAREVSALDGSLVTNEAFTLPTVTQTVIEETVTLGGTARPRPAFNIVIDKPSSLEAIVIKNKSTQQAIEIESQFASGDYLNIDTENFKATIEGNEIEFAGVMPEFEIGSNKLEIFLRDAGGTVAFNETYNKKLAITKGNTYGIFHSTVPTAISGDNLGHFELLIAKNPGATGRLIAKLYDDSGGDGVPDNLLQTKYIDFALIGEGLSWVSINFDDFDAGDLNGSSGGYAVMLEPEDDSSIIYLAYKDRGLTEAIAYKTKNMSAFAIDATKEACYRIFKKLATSYWQLDVNGKYTKRYL